MASTVPCGWPHSTVLLEYCHALPANTIRILQDAPALAPSLPWMQILGSAATAQMPSKSAAAVTTGLMRAQPRERLGAIAVG